MVVGTDVASWGMRLILGMEDDPGTVELHRNGYDTLEEMRASFMRTPQAKALFAAANENRANREAGRPYRIPPFLLRPPASPYVPWRFEEPTLTDPVSQLCTDSQMQGEDFRRLCAELGTEPAQHRKIWEWAYILAVLRSKGMVAKGRRGLGFGTGSEPLPSALAKAGVSVTATDAPSSLELSDAWSKSGQWTGKRDDLWRSDLVDRRTFAERVEFRPADMNRIPADLRHYDFCWSSCCFEHLGSIRHGLDFLKNSLASLKPGGVSVHTTEFNLESNQETIETPALVLFRKRDFEIVIEELVADGHSVEPLNLWPGSTLVDEHIDLPPFTLPHLKLELSGMATTSIGLVITKNRRG